MQRSSTGMPCPVCSVPLTLSERQGIEIDYCPQCRGVWLDRGELDKIIERSGMNAAPPPQAYPSAPSYPAAPPLPAIGPGGRCRSPARSGRRIERDPSRGDGAAAHL